MKDVENMNEETGNGTAEEKKSVTLHALVLRTAAVSVAAIVIAAALLFSVVGCFAPAAYMRLYRSLGAYGIASVYAAEALDRSSPPSGCEDGGCAYITLASDAVEVTAVAFGDDASFARAERLVAACDAYLSADCGALHSAEMDAYYADVYASRPEILCTVYGYDAYVCGERMAALAEASWTEPEEKSYSSFRQRLAPYREMLDGSGINYAKDKICSCRNPLARQRKRYYYNIMDQYLEVRENRK